MLPPSPHAVGSAEQVKPGAINYRRYSGSMGRGARSVDKSIDRFAGVMGGARGALISRPQAHMRDSPLGDNWQGEARREAELLLMEAATVQSADGFSISQVEPLLIARVMTTLQVIRREAAVIEIMRLVKSALPPSVRDSTEVESIAEQAAIAVVAGKPPAAVSKRICQKLYSPWHHNVSRRWPPGCAD